MAGESETLGPVSYLVVEFPGSRMTGEGFPILVDLVDRGAIRILDLVFVSRDLKGLNDTLAESNLVISMATGSSISPSFKALSSGLLEPTATSLTWAPCSILARLPAS